MRHLSLILAILFVLPIGQVFASTLSLSPATGVYTTGSTFTVRVVVNTKGAAINAADGTLSFNPKELQVVSVSRSSSIFNLWTTEPTFSNGAGTITFSGGSPTGYTGSAGTVMTATFRTLGAGSPRVTLTSGSVLAADGRGTNVLTTMGSGAYTVSAVSESPEPEAIVEYVPPANTPNAPSVSSDTHPRDAWSKERTARLTWSLPGDVTAVRTLLDESPTSIPTKVYDTPIRDITLPDLPDGVSYFHIQFRNEDGWGKVTHYRLAVDATAPNNLVLSLPTDANLANPEQVLIATTSDTTGAPIDSFAIQINGGEKQIMKNTEAGKIKLASLKPGRQTVLVEAIDAAGNSVVSTFSFDIESFDAPRFDEVPPEINTGVIPVFIGSTRPRSTVTVTLESTGREPLIYSAESDEAGLFRIIPSARLAEGVYRMTAQAVDEFGAQSQTSAEVSFVVRPAGLLKIGTLLVSALSIIIPLVALSFLLVFICIFALRRYRLFKSAVTKESKEVIASLHHEFLRIKTVLDDHEAEAIASRKSKKLTQSEAELLGAVRAAIASAETVIEKEASDVTALTK